MDLGMSAFGGKADVNHCVGECPLLAMSGRFSDLCRALVYCDRFLAADTETTCHQRFVNHSTLSPARDRIGLRLAAKAVTPHESRVNH